MGKAATAAPRCEFLFTTMYSYTVRGWVSTSFLDCPNPLAQMSAVWARILALFEESSKNELADHIIDCLLCVRALSKIPAQPEVERLRFAMCPEPTLRLALYDIRAPGFLHMLKERADVKRRSRSAIREPDPAVAA